MIQISFKDGHGQNSATVWIDDGGFIVYNKDDNLNDDFDVNNCDYSNVGDGLSFTTVWNSGRDGKELIKEYFGDLDIEEVVNVNGDDYIKDVHYAKINRYQQIEAWTDCTDIDTLLQHYGE